MTQGDLDKLGPENIMLLVFDLYAPKFLHAQLARWPSASNGIIDHAQVFKQEAHLRGNLQISDLNNHTSVDDEIS